ncbi:hypothetical protein K438DRAFT_1798035 [Mycena galopus ATCC 62051]|nr:hypothetical protein K438DRAFT_1798035 [Mycena galopus ATCC 62051]
MYINHTATTALCFTHTIVSALLFPSRRMYVRTANAKPGSTLHPSPSPTCRDSRSHKNDRRGPGSPRSTQPPQRIVLSHPTSPSHCSTVPPIRPPRITDLPGRQFHP